MEQVSYAICNSTEPVQPAEGIECEGASLNAGVEVQEQGENVNISFGLPQLPAPLSEVLSHQELASNLQQLINDLNTKRKSDPTLLDGFKKAITQHAETTVAAVEQCMYDVYEKNNEVIEHKLQELTEVLGRIEKLEIELEQFKHHLGQLYSDVNDTSLPIK